MANQRRATGPERLGGAQPPSSGGYGDKDTSPQGVAESDAPGVNPLEPREEPPDPGEPAAADAPAGVSSEEGDPDDPGDPVERQSLATDGLDG